MFINKFDAVNELIVNPWSITAILNGSWYPVLLALMQHSSVVLRSSAA